MKNTLNTRFFKFKLEAEGTTYTIPQSVNDGSDVIQFQSNWTQTNISGSTEPNVAFNYVSAPTMNINLKFHEDMWRECGLKQSGYKNVINKFASMIYPSGKSTIKPPYCLIYFDNFTYRGYFTSIRINQSGVMRNGYKTTCEISSTFVVIKKYAPTQLGVASGFRTYFK